MNDLRELYGDLADEGFLDILGQFQKVVGVNHEETAENLSGLDRSDKFSHQVLDYFRDVRLLRAMSIESRKIRQRASE